MRGSSLVMTLMVGALVVVVAFALAATGFFHLNVSSRQGASEVARNLAETTLALATDQFMAAVAAGTQTTFGTHNEAVHFQFAGGTADETGTLSFDPHNGTVPWSYNNLASLEAVQGSTRRVPGSCVHLVAVGQAGSVTKTAEAVLYIPRFSQALAAQSTIHSAGGLLVGGVPQGVGALGSIPANLLPADVASNAAGPAAISLGPASHITGNLQAVGGIQLNGAVVDGQVKPSYSPASLPTLDVTSFDTAGRPSLQTLATSSVASLPLSGFARRGGDLDVSGDVTLTRGVLYVDGNLHVHGNVAGTGALITTGTLQIDGCASLSTDNQVALLSRGNVTLTGGGGTAGSFLQGMVYTEGTFRAHDMSLVGVFVASGHNGGVGTMQVDNVRLVSDPDLGQLSLAFQYNPVPGVWATFAYMPQFQLTPADAAAALALPTGASLDDWLRTMHPTFSLSPYGLGMPPNLPPGPLDSQSFVTWLNQNGFQGLLTSGALQAYCQAALAAYQAASPSTTTMFSVDLNQFLAPEDAVRTLYRTIY